MFGQSQTGYRTPAGVTLFALETQAGPAQVDFVARPQFLAATIARRDLARAALAKHTRAELAAVVAETIVAFLEPDVGVAAGYRHIQFIGAFFEDHVVAAHDPVVRVGEFRETADIQTGVLQMVLL